MLASLYIKIKDQNLVPFNQKEWAEFLRTDGDVFCKRTTRTRTDAQNNSLHLYFEMVSRALDEKHFTFGLMIGNKSIQLEPTPTFVKEGIWKPIMKALLGKKSTKELNKTSDIDKIYDTMNKFLSEAPFFIHVPFPNEEKVETKVLETNEDHLLDKQIF